MTGCRVARGGMQERAGLTPDMTCLGKIVGGGLPLAAYGGKREIMEKVAPLGPVYQAGTLSGNPVAVSAALATIERLDAVLYARLESLGARLEDGFRARTRQARASTGACSASGRCSRSSSAGARAQLGRREARATPRASARWHAAMLARGAVLAAVAVRGGVRQRRPHRRRHRRDDRGVRRSARGVTTAPFLRRALLCQRRLRRREPRDGHAER